MGVKEAVSTNYTQAQLALHGAKTLPRLENRRVLVIGADDKTQNIGAVIAERLEHLDMQVWSPPRLELDALNYTAMEAKLKMIDADTLVLANAYTYLDWYEKMPLNEIFKIVNDSLMASMTAAHAFAHVQLDRPFRKQLFFIGSMAYRSVLNGSAAYCAAKAGLAHFARCLAWELAPKGFDVFCINPGNTAGTPMARKTIVDLMRYREMTQEDAEAYWGAVNPRGEWLTSLDIANTVVGLCTGSITPQIAGCNIDLAGGVR